MSAQGAIVGVDVGGTFTDLFWFDEPSDVSPSPRRPRNGETKPSVSSRAYAV